MSDTKTAWQSVRLPRFPKLKESGHYDVLIVGGGITGLTAAYLLKKAGQRVCLLERGQLAQGDTGCTTAHLTFVTDTRISELAKTFGRDGARLAWEGGAAAVNTIEQIAGTEKIECEFQRVPGFFHAALEGERDETRELKRDCALARDLGFAASFVPEAPVVGKPAVLFPNQAKFHPLRYLAGLARAVDGGGCAIHEKSEADEFEEQPWAVKSNGKRITCDFIVIATHVPLMGESGMVSAGLLQTKLASYSSYVVGATIPQREFPEASFWDTSDPYYYLRIDRGRGHDHAIFGGFDHKTGQTEDEDTEQRFGHLERRLKRIIPRAKVDCRWSGQVVETHDGLPFIGLTGPNQFIATGFAGNGMTFGTLAGMMVCDGVLGRGNAWRKLFDPSRKKLRGGAWEFFKQNLDYPYYLVRDRLFGGETDSVRQVKRGEGKVVKLAGHRIACSRDEEGKLTGVSAICTHMGCIVHWNSAEGTWDCPCHGSRFQASGEVLAGPADSPLEPVDVAELKPTIRPASKSKERSGKRSSRRHSRSAK